MVEIVDIHEKKLEIEDHFEKTPIADVNDQYFGLAWFEGEYRPHRHDRDEFFLVLEGHLKIEVDDEMHELRPGMGIIVKAGEVHRSKATIKTLVGIFEPQDINIEFLDSE